MLLLRAFLLLIPIIVYALYLSFVKKQKAFHGESWNDAPWSWLIGSGLMLIVLSFAILRLNPGEPNVYTPTAPRDARGETSWIAPETGSSSGAPYALT